MSDLESTVAAPMGGLAEAPTLAQQLAESPPLGGAELSDPDFPHRYEPRGLLGAGGMGEVRLFHDGRIGREVAVKTLRAGQGATAAEVARFVREARIQGQLEHPAVVPVYDLGADEAGTLCLTMKRLRGLALDAILEGLARGDDALRARYSRRKLLSAFCSICLAVDFAHSRGVIHRDLKPSNVMLGDFGEVYVLDWGIAKVVGETEPTGGAPVEVGPGAATVQGQIVGTPGYMAPEQAKGELDRLDARTDVYALGAILFELLALRPLNHGTTPVERLALAVQPLDARPTAKAPELDVPPELEAVCVRATALRPEERFASARALCEAVERFLDGDRDLERRRAIAAVHAESARRAATRIDEDGAMGNEARAEVMREASRALALDPTDADASSLLGAVMMQPPRETPPEVEEQIRQSTQRERDHGMQIAARSNLLWLPFIPLALWMGVSDWTAAGAVMTIVVLTAATSFVLARRGSVSQRAGIAYFVLTSLVISALSAPFGPFLLVPGLALANFLFFVLMGGVRSLRWIVAAAGVLSILLPFGLEKVGLVAPAYAFDGRGLLVLPRVVAFSAVPTQIFLLVASSLFVVVPLLKIDSFRETLASAERKLLVQAWHLRQLVPEEARPRGSGAGRR